VERVLGHEDIAGLAHRDGRIVDWSFSGSPKWD